MDPAGNRHSRLDLAPGGPGRGVRDHPCGYGGDPALAAVRAVCALSVTGAWAAAWAKLRVPSACASPRNHRSASGHPPADMAQLRDIVAEMDDLPTIKKGKEALGLTTMFGMSTFPVHKRPSPFTHPTQDPLFPTPGVPARPSTRRPPPRCTPREYPSISKELNQVLLGARRRVPRAT